MDATMSFSIGELSRRSGVTVETIRYYERMGLLRPASRSPSGRRMFDTEDVDTLIFVRHCREMLFSTASIRALLPLRSNGPCREVKLIAAQHLMELRKRLKDLAALEEKLSFAVNRCPGDESPACSILALLRSPERSLVPT
jgi:MerR family mercuric resistance operon transcriptional regulator